MVMHLSLGKGYTFWHVPQWPFIAFLLFFITGTPTEASEQVTISISSPLIAKSSILRRFCNVEDFSSNDTKTCQDLNGIGSLDSTCLLNSNLEFDGDLCVYGAGNLEISAYVSIRCPIGGCYMVFNISGSFKIGPYAALVAGSIAIEAENITLEHHSSLNTTTLGGVPPSQTSGTPSTLDGSGGGHGGRGASCTKYNKVNWGGDVYAWSTLSDPWSYGSKGGSTSAQLHYGGGGGGRIMLKANDTLYVDGSVYAEGGEGGLKGGGGSGGSIRIHVLKLKGKGVVSAAGGRGWGGGGGGRISLQCYSKQDVLVTVHGGQSIGCPGNAGAAGTVFDNSMHSLKVDNGNLTTDTETPLLDFPTSMLWSDVFVENNAKVLVPLLWTRVQVRGQIKLLNGGHISFGLSEFPVSEFELVAEELLMSESVIMVYGAFRMYVKMLLMWDSKIQIDGGGNTDVTTSFLEARNLVVLRHKSVISSNAVLGVNGQGLLKLSGPGDAIKGQRLFLSLFYNIEVGPGSLLQAPLDDEMGSNLIQSLCQSSSCPIELIAPPEDCHVNSSLSITVQICRVEDLIINGMLRGSVLLVHRARTVSINDGGMITASELGCKKGIGEGKFLGYGAGGGGGHGGRGGPGYFNGTFSDGGQVYGDANLPCELGSGSGEYNLPINAAGGGLIVIGSRKWPLSRMENLGSLNANGQSHIGSIQDHGDAAVGGIGGGSGGTILLFLQELVISDNSRLSVSGGNGSAVGGGGGGGGRVHFHWSNIATGDEYVKIASINGTIDASGGNGTDGGLDGHSGTVTGSACPRGLFGTFCSECPVGTYKDVVGSDPSLCRPCLLHVFPRRAVFTYVRGGVTQSSCPYKCLSEKYKMPNCYTPLEELLYMFGGPWFFALALSFSLVLLAILLSALRVKLVGADVSYQSTNSVQRDGSGTFPYLLSLAEVQGTSKAEETQSHVHRMYFMGPNTFREPWHLPHSPPDAVIGIVYEDAFNRFIDEINSVTAYEWWEGSVYFILSVLAYPCAWSWKQWRRKSKIRRLQEYVKSEYDHACLRSCRSRALYKGMKVGSTPDLMVAYIDFFLGGDEKHLVITSAASQRFPMCIIFGGDGSYMSPYYLHNDSLLGNLIGQYVPAPTWNKFTSGLNARLRTIRQGTIRVSLCSVISWLNSHVNFHLEHFGVKVELGWFQSTASGYYQLGILVSTSDHFVHQSILNASSSEKSRRSTMVNSKSIKLSQSNQPRVNLANNRRRLTGGVNGGIINETALKSLDYKRDYLFPFSLLLQNRKPIGLQGILQFLIAIILLGDFAVTLLTLLEFYWISLVVFLAVLLVLPLSLLSPFPAGLNALFSRGPKRSSLARIYALWNVTSLSNTIVSFICGIVYCRLLPVWLPEWSYPWKANRDDGDWWILPTILLALKLLQAVLVNWHIANQEIQDHSLFSQDPRRFWES